MHIDYGRFHKPRRPRLLAAMAAAVGLLAAMHGVAAKADDTITVRHAQGETAVPVKPGRVGVFDLAALDSLDGLGIAADGVPKARLPDYLAHYDKATVAKIGSLFEPDYEAVRALDPDLIIVGGRSASKYADLAAIAPTIDLSTDRADFIESAARNVETLGRIYRVEDRAAAAAEELRRKAAALRKRGAEAGNALVLLATAKRMSAQAGGSRFGAVHAEFGFPEAPRPDPEEGARGVPMDAEAIATSNPDWLFVIDREAAVRGEGVAAQMLDDERIRQTTAFRDDRIVMLDPVSWYLVGGGLRSVDGMIAQIDAALLEPATK